MGKDCPLCHAPLPEPTARVLVRDLDHLYRQRFDVSVRDHFPGVAELRFYTCPVCALKYFDPLVTGSREFYLQLNQQPWYYLEEKSEYRTAASVIPQGAKVLDIGCGEGKFSRSIPECEYVGLERNLPEDQRLAGGRVRIIPEGIEEHAAGHAGVYDAVCAFQVLEHIAGVSTFIERALECLKPGGLLIISVPAADSFISGTVNGVLNMPPHHLTWWPDEALAHISRQYGLELVSIIHEPLEKIHYRRYAFNWALAWLHRLPGLRAASRNRLIDRSFRFRLLTLLLLPVAALRLIMLRMDAGTIAGHSVVALYRKGK